MYMCIRVCRVGCASMARSRASAGRLAGTSPLQLMIRRTDERAYSVFGCRFRSWFCLLLIALAARTGRRTHGRLDRLGLSYYGCGDIGVMGPGLVTESGFRISLSTRRRLSSARLSLFPLNGSDKHQAIARLTVLLLLFGSCILHTTLHFIIIFCGKRDQLACIRVAMMSSCIACPCKLTPQ